MPGAPATAERSEAGPGEPRDAQISELAAAFRRVFRSLSRVRGRDTHLAAGALSHAQFELLLALHERGELAAGELAAAAGLTPGTVTQMLDHLADCGHVERVRSDSDRRVVVSRLTEQGRSRIEAKRTAWKERWERALAGLDGEQLKAATSVLERLGAMVEETPAPGPEEPFASAPKSASQPPQE
ncbi:MAG TPA: MarR family winged helix-turn-helix transcriptional regulator [Solirubrobacteraceae bacterium]|jgi:DNA-binding MarR family transcriptional regulator